MKLMPHNMTPDMMGSQVIDHCEEILALPFLMSGHMTGRITWLDATLWLAQPPDHVVEAAAPT